MVCCLRPSDRNDSGSQHGAFAEARQPTSTTASGLSAVQPQLSSGLFRVHVSRLLGNVRSSFSKIRSFAGVGDSPFPIGAGRAAFSEPASATRHAHPFSRPDGTLSQHWRRPALKDDIVSQTAARYLELFTGHTAKGSGSSFLETDMAADGAGEEEEEEEEDDEMELEEDDLVPDGTCEDDLPLRLSPAAGALPPVFNMSGCSSSDLTAAPHRSSSAGASSSAGRLNGRLASPSEAGLNAMLENPLADSGVTAGGSSPPGLAGHPARSAAGGTWIGSSGAAPHVPPTASRLLAAASAASSSSPRVVETPGGSVFLNSIAALAAGGVSSPSISSSQPPSSRLAYTGVVPPSPVIRKGPRGSISYGGGGGNNSLALKVASVSFSPGDGVPHLPVQVSRPNSPLVSPHPRSPSTRLLTTFTAASASLAGHASRHGTAPVLSLEQLIVQSYMASPDVYVPATDSGRDSGDEGADDGGGAGDVAFSSTSWRRTSITGGGGGAGGGGGSSGPSPAAGGQSRRMLVGGGGSGVLVPPARPAGMRSTQSMIRHGSTILFHGNNDIEVTGLPISQLTSAKTRRSAAAAGGASGRTSFSIEAGAAGGPAAQFSPPPHGGGAGGGLGLPPRPSRASGAASAALARSSVTSTSAKSPGLLSGPPLSVDTLEAAAAIRRAASTYTAPFRDSLHLDGQLAELAGQDGFGGLDRGGMGSPFEGPSPPSALQVQLPNQSRGLANGGGESPFSPFSPFTPFTPDTAGSSPFNSTSNSSNTTLRRPTSGSDVPLDLPLFSSRQHYTHGEALLEGPPPGRAGTLRPVAAVATDGGGGSGEGAAGSGGQPPRAYPPVMPRVHLARSSLSASQLGSPGPGVVDNVSLAAAALGPGFARASHPCDADADAAADDAAAAAGMPPAGVSGMGSDFDSEEEVRYDSDEEVGPDTEPQYRYDGFSILGGDQSEAISPQHAPRLQAGPGSGGVTRSPRSPQSVAAAASEAAGKGGKKKKGKVAPSRQRVLQALGRAKG